MRKWDQEEVVLCSSLPQPVSQSQYCLLQRKPLDINTTIWNKSTENIRISSKNLPQKRGIFHSDVDNDVDNQQSIEIKTNVPKRKR